MTWTIIEVGFQFKTNVTYHDMKLLILYSNDIMKINFLRIICSYNYKQVIPFFSHDDTFDKKQPIPLFEPYLIVSFYSIFLRRLWPHTVYSEFIHLLL